MALSTLLFGDGPADTGWTFYAPYSVKTGTNVTMSVLAAFVLGFSSILTGLNFIVTIHRLRTPGMTFLKMPLFSWALYATSWIQLLATPIIGITLLMITAERVFGVGLFDPSIGGDPILYQHLFWIYSHPAVYIMHCRLSESFLSCCLLLLIVLFLVTKPLLSLLWPLLLLAILFGGTSYVHSRDEWCCTNCIFNYDIFGSYSYCY